MMNKQFFRKKITWIITIVIFSIFFANANANAQTIIGEGLYEEDLLNYVVTNYKTSSTLGYTNCRDVMYSEIDLKPGNQLSGIYSGYSITMDLEEDPSSYAYQNGINCEHTWPQSMGAGDEPQKSDMHHLYPCKDNVNSSRSNDPFGEIPNSNADRWYRLDEVLYIVPSMNIDEYSEKENDDPDYFEPRESVKGDIARSMFYFYAMYQTSANTAFWNSQKEVLHDWHYADPVDAAELARTWAIASYQDNMPNPFLIDPTLVSRIWFHLPAPEITNIYANNNSIYLEWSSVDGATSYKVYSSDNPKTGFTEDTSGTINGTSWSTSVITEVLLYNSNQVIKNAIKGNQKRLLYIVYKA